MISFIVAPQEKIAEISIERKEYPVYLFSIRKENRNAYFRRKVFIRTLEEELLRKKSKTS